jgi:hypothetical protein
MVKWKYVRVNQNGTSWKFIWTLKYTMKVRQKQDTLNYNSKWMHATMYTKNCPSLIVLSTYPSFMHHGGNLGNNFHWNFIKDDSLCLNLTLCCEINAHMNGVNPTLGGTTRNHLKEWLKNQKQPNHFYGPILLNVFTTINYYLSCLSIACFNIWLQAYLGILKFYIHNFKRPLRFLTTSTLEIHN